MKEWFNTWSKKFLALFQESEADKWERIKREEFKLRREMEKESNKHINNNS